jgi:hypothetical protein
MSICDHFKELRCVVKRIDRELHEYCKCDRAHLCRVLDIDHDGLFNKLKNVVQKIENDISATSFLVLTIDQQNILAFTLQVMANFNRTANKALKETHNPLKTKLVENLITAALAVEAKVDVWVNKQNLDAFVNLSSLAYRYTTERIRRSEDFRFELRVRQ